MLLTEFQHLISDTFPPAAAMPGDAIGLQVESRRGTAQRVLVALEITDLVLEEAIKDACDVVLVFHPLIYAPLSQIRRDDRVGRLVAGLIEADIALVSVHTAFDAFPQGTNFVLAHRLGLTNTSVLVPGDLPGFGMGLVGSFSGSFEDLVDRVASVCGSPVRYMPPPATLRDHRSQLRVALVGGSGASFTSNAIAVGADVFITADLKYHAFHAADGHIGLIDPGHFEMEQFVPDGILTVLQSIVGTTCRLVRSSVSTNPVRYASPLPQAYSSSC